MTRFVVGTQSVKDSKRIGEYLAERATGDDEIFVVNALADGSDDTDLVKAGKRAADELESALGNLDVETHQFIRDKDPSEELLAFASEHDADELVIGIHERNPTGKVIFGSTAQQVLLNTSIPVVSVPIRD
ncbi:universal stress protein [Natrinema gelatinilyticum]|uniref:universal stress protein n=1 Tax=Natrinema gelatinilyticum TaxID=2961571 RepID=UPI0020C38F34|nr:universal stress protein [Natrinema gelatinilyticum]